MTAPRSRAKFLEDHRARRELDVRLDQAQRRTPPGDERLFVDVRALDVLEPAQREEVVLLVVVERRFVTQAPEQRVRVVRDLLRRRVIVRTTHRTDSRLSVPALSRIRSPA
jgi:hypothetical protein